MCQSCGHLRNWSYSAGCCSCGCSRIYKGEPGIQGRPGTPGATGNGFTVGVYAAFAGGGQLGATNLTDNDNLVNTVATTGDSVKLLPAVKNTIQTVRNYGANAMDVFPQAAEQIDSLGANVPFSLAAGATITFVCFVNGTFVSGT